MNAGEQVYRVVFSPRVAVRAAPSRDAAVILVHKTGDEVVVGKMAQLDKWGHDFEIAVSGGLDPWIVCSVLTSCRPGSGGGAGAGGWSGAGGAY